ncbi:MAG: SUMF1/EgtB/PvdO family nonheme iron enzyme [Corynebacteriales bacterium]|nr:SUMF1/EgtB/PvdO family nonheme iron enzyme [Mycobacteriales bacterium]
MVRIAGGSVDRRDERRGARWQVDIAPFLLGAFPVTLGLYRSLTGVETNSANSSATPITNVSWLDAIEFCNLLSTKSGLEPVYTRSPEREEVNWDRTANGFRLPSEAEWQYACKAGTSGYRYGQIDDIAWYEENSGGHVHDVGTKTPNSWGLYDMLGNVWEWCWDLYDEEVYGSYRIFRGGGWAESERGCGATVRRRSHPTFAIDDLGFRLARNASGAS